MFKRTIATMLRCLLERALPRPETRGIALRRAWTAAGMLLALLLSAPAHTQNLLANGSFETPALASGSYQYNPSGTGWTMIGNSGIQANGSAWVAPTASDGTQTAFLQMTGSITQSVNLASAGSYTLSFQAAQRACCVAPYAQSVNVSIDGVVIGNATPASTTSYTAYSYTFQAAAGTHTIGLAGTRTVDNTAFIDRVSLIGVLAASITAPANNSRFASNAAIALTADASEPGGTIAKVEFFSGTALIGTVLQPPYTFNWTNLTPGSFTVTAKATDIQGATVTSQPVTVYVDVPPTVSLNGPAATPPLVAPASVSLSATATASGTNNAITRVAFYNGTTLLGTVTAAPYDYNWANVAAGSYTVTAVATDSLGMATTSAPVNVTVGGVAAQVYYIEADQLNTPRRITNAANQPVWQWDNNDPFGNNIPNADPSSTGTAFEFNLRFPGQYFDKETNLHYNYFRDYDPATGRYVQSDPIGTVLYKDMAAKQLAATTMPVFAELATSLYSPDPAYNHPYAYGLGNPLTYTDPEGLFPGGVGGSSGSRGGMSCGTDKNCETLRDNILRQTCASIKNPRARAACVAAAWLTYYACLAG